LAAPPEAAPLIDASAHSTSCGGPHFEVYKTRKDWEKQKRDRSVWDNGCIRQKFWCDKAEVIILSADQPKRPDDISDQFLDGSIQLTTRIIPPESQENDVPTIIIEGDAVSLEYLGKLILAQVAFPLDCGYGISPKGAGNAFFKKGSEVGIYFHRLPCMGDGLENGGSDNESPGDLKHGSPK
jgi:hypothetical protein